MPGGLYQELQPFQQRFKGLLLRQVTSSFEFPKFTARFRFSRGRDSSNSYTEQGPYIRSLYTKFFERSLKWAPRNLI